MASLLPAAEASAGRPRRSAIPIDFILPFLSDRWEDFSFAKTLIGTSNDSVHAIYKYFDRSDVIKDRSGKTAIFLLDRNIKA